MVSLFQFGSRLGVVHFSYGFSNLHKVQTRVGGLKNIGRAKNLGRLWLAYTELQGDFYMLQFISVDSRHFTHT